MLLKWVLAGLGALSLVLGAWGLTERHDRQKSERAHAALQDQFDAQGSELRRGVADGQAQAKRIEKFQDELRELSARMAEETLKHRAMADGLLSDKAALHAQADELAKKLEDTDTRSKALGALWEQEQAKRQKTEAQLAAEKDAARTALEVQRAEAQRAQALAKQKEEELWQTSNERDALEQKAKQASGAAREAGIRNDRLANDLQRSLQDRDNAAITAQHAQLSAAQALDLLRLREADLRGQRERIACLERDILQFKADNDRLVHSNRLLTDQVRALQAELDRLKKQPGTPPPPAGSRGTPIATK